MEFKNIKHAKGFYNVSLKHLTESKTLHEKEKYSGAIFSLQQSVETLVKSIGILYDIIEPSDVRKKISHKPYRLYIEIAKKMLNIISEKSDSESADSDIPEVIVDTIKKGLETFIGVKFDGYCHISEEKMELLLNKLNILKSITSVINSTPVDGVKMITKMCTEIEISENNTTKFDGIQYNIIRMMGNESFLKTVPNNTNNMPEIGSKMYSVIVLFVLSLLTTPHNQLTRYPCEQCGKTPDDNYTTSNIIVKKYADLVSIYEDALLIFNHISQIEHLILKKELS